MKTRNGSNYSVADVGSLSTWRDGKFTHQALGTVKGKNFLKEALNLSGMEVSLNVFPASHSMPFYHRHHQNEELYLFIKGKGQFQVDEDTFDVKEGSMVRVAPAGARIWRNTGTEDLYYIVIQSRANSMQQGDVSDGSIVEKEIRWPEATAAI